MAATAATTLNPARFATSSSSTSVSSNARFPYTQIRTARAPLPRTMPKRSTATVGTLPAYDGTEITATSSFVIEAPRKSCPLSVRSTVTVFPSSGPATRPDTFSVPPVGLNTISNTLIEHPPLRLVTRQAARMLGQSIRHAGTPPCTNPMLSAHGLHNSRCRLHIFTEYRRVLPRYPTPGRAKNGVFCNVAASAPPRVSKTAGHCIILSPDIARMTHLCSRKRQNLTQTAR